MRELVRPSIWWKRTSLGDTAENSFTGTFTSPKLMAPLQIARGMFLFSHHGARVLVFAQTLERRVAQHTVVGPLGELDFANELRLDPHRAGDSRRALE